ncbi:MAG TPA: histidinol-phosphate transaminase [Paenarthrobacter sp.]|nr:histidinol-phosphate transaminase [Paenarthrobacter sp.]
MTDQLERLDRLPLRTNLRGLSPYGAPQLDVPILLNVNENTHGVPADVQAAITEAVAAAATGLNRYPDREFTELREALAGFLGHGLTPANIWAANGSNEVLQQILQAFGGPGRKALGFPPTYSMYPLLASGTDTEYVRGVRGEDFSLDAASAAAQVAEAGANIVFLCSPNNPTGTGLGLDVVEAVYEAGEASQAIVIVDEAYHEFAHDNTPSALTLLPGRQRLIVSRTMSKAFALAGARLGYMAAAPEVTDALRLVRLPYHLSAVTQATALAALQHREALMADVEDIKVQRDRIVTELLRMGLKPAASDSNYVFFGGLENPHAIWQGLLDAGVLIRDVGIPGHLRVTAGTEPETTAFLEALEALLAGDAKAAPGQG